MYENRYPNTWEQELTNKITKLGYVCVIELVDHMINETTKIFEGTRHQDTCMIYHDAFYDEFTRHGKRYHRADGKGDCKNKPKAIQRKDTQTCRPLHPDAVEAYEIIMNDDDVNQLNMLEGIPLHAEDENLAQLVQVDAPGDGIVIPHDEPI